MWLFWLDCMMGTNQNRQHFFDADLFDDGYISNSNATHKHQSDLLCQARMAAFVTQGVVADELSPTVFTQKILLS
jgi:hypothetical protein